MPIHEMLKRFRPLYAADGDGGGGGGGEAAATVAAIVSADKANETGEAESGEEEYELPEDETGEAAEPEYEDYDLDGVRVKVPKDALQAVKDAAYRQSDYTNKTKEIAAAKKAADEARTAYEQRAQEDETFNEGRFHLKNIDADLAKRYQYFQSPEYRQLREDDPLKARGLYDDFSMDKDKRDTLAAALGRMQQERNSKAADEAREKTEADSRLREQALRQVAKTIPGWNADLQAKVRESAIANGFDAAAIDGITDPKHWEILHFARIGRIAAAGKARNGAGAVRTQATTTTRTVGQGTAPAGNSVSKLDRASPSDYVAMRRKQMAG